MENGANATAAVLSEFRDTWNGGSFLYDPSWTYAGYESTTDSFVSAQEDDAGIDDCTDPTTPCPATHACVTPTDESPADKDGGVCARLCPMGNECGGNPGRTCVAWPTTGTGPNVCWPNGYANDWFTHAVGRLAVDAGARDALDVLFDAAPGTSNNGTRDLAVGEDTWYAAMIDANIMQRFETTRAVRSVTSEPGTAEREDFTGWPGRALPITVVTSAGTPIWWGNGTWAYPSFEDIWDQDYVMFRAKAGTTYEVSAQPAAGSSVDLQIAVYRWTSGLPLVASGFAPSGPTAVLPVSGLADDWYVVSFLNRAINSGAWQGRIRISGAGSAGDELGDTWSAAYPMPSGVPIAGSLHVGDADRFKIWVPVTGTSLTATSTGTPTPTVEVYRPDGSMACFSWTGGCTVPSTNQIGHWTWRVRDASSVARSYTTSATLGCASWTSASCDDFTGDPALPTAYSWGDRVAGRLPTAESWVEYRMDLAEDQEASFALAHNGQTSCRLQLDLYGPSAMTYWSNGRIWRWLDLTGSGGAAAGDPSGSRLGAGGHVQAPIAGTYFVRVSSSNAGTDCHYRLFLAKGSLYGSAMPSW